MLLDHPPPSQYLILFNFFIINDFFSTPHNTLYKFLHSSFLLNLLINYLVIYFKKYLIASLSFKLYIYVDFNITNFKIRRQCQDSIEGYLAYESGTLLTELFLILY